MSNGNQPEGIPPLQFGNPESWKYFLAHYKTFLDRFDNLKSALDTCFNRSATSVELVDRIIFFSGRLAVEDFFEILLLVGNGYGVGALKILRGMYERVVTAHYLHLHPEEADKFWDFHSVQQHKATVALRKTFGEATLPKERVDEVEAGFREVKEKFRTTLCLDRGRKGLAYTWGLDFVSMAAKAGDLGKYIVPAYYLPLREAHSTAGAIVSRLKESPNGVEFDGGPQNEQGHTALLTAHSLLIHLLKLQQKHFQLAELEEPLRTCWTDFQETW
jgi:Family of unknown function (DUF5677)